MDELYPNDGSYYQPTEPAEQIQERKEEKGKVKEGIRLLEDVIERFEERIRFYDSVNSVPGEFRIDPAEFMHRVEANDLTKQNLIVEKTWLEGLRDTYK